MPLIPHSTYRPSPWLRNGHLETIYPVLFRKVPGVEYERERLELSDGDFLDLDWLDGGHRRLMVITHGMEGNTGKHYVRGMAKIFQQNRWDVLAWNCRSCGGEMNRNLRIYHHGDTHDIGEVIGHALRTKDYESIVLSGFSMGGNINLKYLGVLGRQKPDAIKANIAFSAPTELAGGAEMLNARENFIYRQRFMHYLRKKMALKNDQYPGVIDLADLKRVRVWQDFDELFSAKLNGFASAADFYEQASAGNFMDGTDVPTLLVQALNDPILPPTCYPRAQCERHPLIHLEIPRSGGHVGFWQPQEVFAWSEKRALAFVQEVDGTR